MSEAYPGKFHTPDINMSGFGHLHYWTLSDIERDQARKRWAAEQRKPWNRFKSLVRHWRGKIADFIAPEGWYDE